MERTTQQQIRDLFEKETSILVVLPNNPSTDSIASGLALLSFLEKSGKHCKVVAYDFQLPPNHRFLSKSNEIATDLAGLQKFVISLDISRTKVEELAYDIAGNKLNIFITPKGGYFTPRQVTTSAGAYEYSLIVVLDAPDLESLGALFDENAEFFYNTPVINMAHQASNTNFGQVNLVDLTATSTSEVLFELMREINADFLDENIATSLLAGIISKTKSFQSTSVTPKSLSIASLLITSGGRRDEIIQQLYQTKDISMLRLWGRALARLQSDFQGRFVWTALSRQDFEQSGGQINQLTGVVDDLIVNTPKAEVIAVLYEPGPGGSVEALIGTSHTIQALVLFREFLPQGTRDFITIRLSTANLKEAETLLHGHLRSHYKTR